MTYFIQRCLPDGVSVQNLSWDGKRQAKHKT